ncbi:MAG: UbiA prenyltransferase family protein [Gemmatimonadaceae bacterium]|nr:UbiA prenyltransferase family protein [Chitinophagaceae bacterium]
MPVYLFALSQVLFVNWYAALLVFFILHFLVYPASNGYNSYMDRDQSPVGGISNPMQPTRQLFMVTITLDIAAILLSFFITPWFALGIVFYILASRAYSYRGIRLKKFPVIGYLTVVVFQGAATFWLVYHGCHEAHPVHLADNVKSGMLASSLLIGGFYPLTQIYQHKADREDGVKSISSILGYRGTFLFTSVVYSVAFAVLAYHFFVQLEWNKFFVLATCMLPILVYFFRWWAQVRKNNAAADFRNTMRMNIIAAICTNLGFIIIIIWNLFE